MEEGVRAPSSLQKFWPMPISNRGSTFRLFRLSVWNEKGLLSPRLSGWIVFPLSSAETSRTRAVVIVLDSSLLRKVDVAHGAKPDALILLNCRENENQNPIKGSFRVAGVDAVKIALQHGLGSKTAPIINTVILGAYARVSGDLTLSNLLEAIEKGVPVNPKQNMAAAEAAYQAVFRISGDVNAD